MAKFQVGDRVKVIANRFPSSFGQQGTVTNVWATLPAARSDSIAARGLQGIGPWYPISFDKSFDGEFAIYREGEIAKI